MPTLVVSELARNADNAQLLGCNPSVLAKEAELVAHLDDQYGIQVLPLDVEKLDFHGRQLASLGTLLLGLCRRRGFILLSIALAFIITIQAGALAGTLKLAPSERGETVGVTEFLHKLPMQFILLPLQCGILVNLVGPSRIQGRATRMISISLSPGRGARAFNGGLRRRVLHLFGGDIDILFPVIVVVWNRPCTLRSAAGSAGGRAVAIAGVFLQRPFASGFGGRQDRGGGRGRDVVVCLFFLDRFLVFFCDLVPVRGLLAEPVNGEEAGQRSLPLLWRPRGARHGGGSGWVRWRRVCRGDVTRSQTPSNAVFSSFAPARVGVGPGDAH